MFCVCFFYLLTPKHKLSNLYLLHKLVGCFFFSVYYETEVICQASAAAFDIKHIMSAWINVVVSRLKEIT